MGLKVLVISVDLEIDEEWDLGRPRVVGELGTGGGSLLVYVGLDTGDSGLETGEALLTEERVEHAGLLVSPCCGE